MLKDYIIKDVVPKDEYMSKKKQLKDDLYVLQQRIKEEGLPTIIIFEGWNASGKGSRIRDLIMDWDPRGFKVHSIIASDETEKRYPPMQRYWQRIPQKGEIAVFDQSWYFDAQTKDLDKKERYRTLGDIHTFERTLRQNGYLIIKFFLHISQKEQKSRFKELLANKNSAWRVTKEDLQSNKNYKEQLKRYNFMLENTNFDFAPWHIIDATDRRSCRVQIGKTVLEQVHNTLQTQAQTTEKIPKLKAEGTHESAFPLCPPPPLKKIDLSLSLSEEEYADRLKRGQKRLAELHNKLYCTQKTLIVAFEGWDGAGKGGAIKRLTRGLDARGCETIPIAAPQSFERNRHYLWRFWRNVPKSGHITVFDRTWYGRCMVERVEGFCTEADYKRAYNEINEFEDYLSRNNIAVVKFWIHIDKDEQLKRFTDRQNTPAKQWKITEEDWRNREKWDTYQVAIEEMFAKTSTEFAPWHIISGNDKNFARIQVIETVIKALESL